MDGTYMLTDACLEVLIELCSPEVIAAQCCLKLEIVYIKMREVLPYVGINIAQRKGLYIPQAIVNVLFNKETNLQNEPSPLISE